MHSQQPGQLPVPDYPRGCSPPQRRLELKRLHPTTPVLLFLDWLARTTIIRSTAIRAWRRKPIDFLHMKAWQRASQAYHDTLNQVKTDALTEGGSDLPVGVEELARQAHREWEEEQEHYDGYGERTFIAGFTAALRYAEDAIRANMHSPSATEATVEGGEEAIQAFKKPRGQ